MKHLHRLLITASVIGAISDVSAQELFNRSWYLLPSINRLDADSDYGAGKRGTGAGLRFGTPLSDNWDFQIGGAHARIKQSGTRYQQDILGMDWLYMFSREPFRPFLLVGFGAERDKISLPLVSSNKTSPYLAAGLGFQFDFSDHWGTQLDYRRVHGRLRDNAFGIDRSDNDYVTLGLIYRFDRAPRRPMRIAQAEPAQRPAPVYVQNPAPVQRQEPVIAPPPPPPPPRFERYVLSSTELFEFDRAELNGAHAKLDEIAAALNGNPQIAQVSISGHTDRLGSDAYNLELSSRRAETVKRYLIDKGVSAERVVATGRGEASPVVDCTERNRAALIKCLEPNRRVEVEQFSFQRRAP